MGRRNTRTSRMEIGHLEKIRTDKDVREGSPDARVLHLKMHLSLNGLGVWNMVELSATLLMYVIQLA